MATCPVCNAVFADGEGQCPQCGFKMLGATQAFKPISMDPSSNAAPASLLGEASLRIVKGHQAGSVFTLADNELTVGRSPQCDIFLNDMTVSRMHATMVRRATNYEIIDADSYNGLWVNNINVHEALLKDGDVIQIGTFCLLYQSTPGV